MNLPCCNVIIIYESIAHLHFAVWTRRDDVVEKLRNRITPTTIIHRDVATIVHDE